jgi:hypothetical protein
VLHHERRVGAPAGGREDAGERGACDSRRRLEPEDERRGELSSRARLRVSGRRERQLETEELLRVEAAGPVRGRRTAARRAVRVKSRSSGALPRGAALFPSSVGSRSRDRCIKTVVIQHTSVYPICD